MENTLVFVSEPNKTNEMTRFEIDKKWLRISWDNKTEQSERYVKIIVTTMFDIANSLDQKCNYSKLQAPIDVLLSGVFTPLAIFWIHIHTE